MRGISCVDCRLCGSNRQPPRIIPIGSGSECNIVLKIPQAIASEIERHRWKLPRLGCFRSMGNGHDHLVSLGHEYFT